jgi:hypothetical protein
MKREGIKTAVGLRICSHNFTVQCFKEAFVIGFTEKQNPDLGLPDTNFESADFETVYSFLLYLSVRINAFVSEQGGI